MYLVKHPFNLIPTANMKKKHEHAQPMYSDWSVQNIVSV